MSARDSNISSYSKDKDKTRELQLSEKLFDQQNTLDEKIVKNMLKLNVFIYFATTFFVSFFILCSENIFSIKPFIQVDFKGYNKITFGLLQFTQYVNKDTRNDKDDINLKNATNFYFCLKNSETCENNCTDVDLNEIQRIFQFECSKFSQFYFAGIIFLLGLLIGVTLNAISLISIILLILKKINLNKIEAIFTFTKFESLVYFLFSIEYIFHTGVLFNSQLNIGIAFYSIIIFIIMSLVNYLCFRASFYSMLRINSRINFNEEI